MALDDQSAHVPVLIIGGGIAGLSAFLFLSQHGIKPMLVERHSGTSIHPRARSVNARSMEIYRSVGLSDQIREAGASIGPSFGIYTGKSVKSVIEPKPRRTGNKKSPWIANSFSSLGPEPGTFVTQDMSEPVLLEAAKQRQGDVRFYTECLGLEQADDKVTARLRNRDTGNTSTITADYVIAADGANSPVRRQLKVETTGRGTMGHLLNVLFEADLKSFVENREFSMCVVEHPEVVGIVTSINNSDRWVCHIYYDPSKGEKPEDYPPERCIELLRLALGFPELDIKIKSILPWEPSVRVATNLHHGRVFLAGDAAHQMPPYGGQGANSGVSDVYNLAWKLAAVLNGTAGEKLLDTYNIERQPVGKAAAEASAGPADDRGLLSVAWSLKKIPSFLAILSLVAGLGYVYTLESRAVISEDTWPLGGVSWKSWTLPSLALNLDGRPGSRVPHIWVERDGKRVSTLDVVDGGFVLLAGSDGRAWTKACTSIDSKFKGLQLASYVVGSEGDLVDRTLQWNTAAGISPSGALLVRPDGYVAMRERRQPVNIQEKLDKVLKQILCL